MEHGGARGHNKLDTSPSQTPPRGVCGGMGRRDRGQHQLTHAQRHHLELAVASQHLARDRLECVGGGATTLPRFCCVNPVEHGAVELLRHRTQHAVADEHARRLGEGGLGGHGVRHHGTVGCRQILLLKPNTLRRGEEILQDMLRMTLIIYGGVPWGNGCCPKSRCGVWAYLGLGGP